MISESLVGVTFLHVLTMPWNYSLKLVVFLFILVSCFSNFPTTAAQQEEVTDFPGHCSENVTTNSFWANVKSLFSSFSSNATVRPFYNDTVGGGNTSDTVYGLFMCRGDVPSQLCEQCVRNATQILSSRCYLSTKAIIWYRYCMVRYSNTCFFSILNTSAIIVSINFSNASNQAIFIPVLADTMNKTADEAAASGSRYFATKEASISENQTLYSLAQCTQDLSPQDCTTCLSSLIAEIPKCCVGRMSVAIFSYSCGVFSELFPFYYRLNTSLLLLPPTNSSSVADPDSYLSHHCPNNGTLYDYSARTLKTLLLSYLSSNATANIRDGGDNNYGFYKTDVEGTVFGLFMCRPDIPPRLCGECVGNATHRLASQCHSSVEAIVFYNLCLLRYSNHPFFSTVSTVPRFDNLNVTKVKDVERSFMFTKLSNVLTYVAVEIARNNSVKKGWWTESFVLNDYQTIYVLAQCTRDLSCEDCYGCLYDVIGSGIPWSKLASVGGRVVYPSCNLRFELFQFYSQNHHSLSPPPTSLSPIIPPPKGRNGLSRAIISSIVPIVIISVMLFSFYCYLLRKQARKSHKNILKENFGPESTTVESLQFDLAIIKIATNNFSLENRIGRGGFGEVYKGVLSDGRYIAVKRLSSSSKQGVAEFKNEVLLIARLQHRNLVTFIGFCLEEQEKILIYEYVPNKSLDYFLFDPHLEKLLNWTERYKIIEGIARGVLYLHEYSRLKIIHRDIKPSNILLDENMNPKISDFGLARIVEIDQQHGSTNKIVGTLGYMSPEYTLQGQFSEKLDVFSFGVMVLEIITGKKNVASHKSHRAGDGGLLSLVWREYRDQTPLSILDPKLKDSYSEIEVSRCIQIGLLCVQEDPADRPTMINIVSYFSNPLFELPIPQEPVFFLRRKMDQEIVACESRLSSVNVMSISSFDPR